MKPIHLAAAICVGLAAPAWAQPQRTLAGPGAGEAGRLVVAQSAPVPEGATGGRSGTPNQEQYKPKKKKKAKKSH